MSTVISVGKIGLAVGLDWRLLPAATKKHSIDQIIRELAHDNDAQRMAVAARASDNQATVGLFVQPDAEDIGSAGIPAKLYAAAAVLASMAGESQNVIAAIAFKDSADRDRVAVLVVEGGLPVSDAVQAPDKAIDTVRTIRAGEAGFAGHRVFSNSPEIFGATIAEVEDLALDDLAQAARQEARLSRIPLNLRVLVASLAVLFVLVASVAGATIAWQSQQAKKRAAEARARDPIPKYEAALVEQIHNLGIARASMLALATSLSDYPAWVRGWELKQVVCNVKACRSSWERRGGTTTALLAERPGETLDPGDSTADKAILVWQPKGVATDGWVDLQKAPRQAEALAANQSLYQTWANAGIQLQQSGAYAVWPSTGLDVPTDVALKSQPIEIRLPWTLAHEAIAKAPREVFWSQLAVAVDIGSKTQALQAVLTGTSYVR